MATTRRHMLQLGLGALASSLVTPAARGANASPSPKTRARACILLFMHGGMSQIDTLDPKPGRATGGPFRAIRTALPGVRISEHLPGIAQRLDQVALLRSVTSREGNHDRARYLMHTGYPPQGGARHPALGAWVAQASPGGSLPGYVAINAPGQGPGLLGAARAPFVVRDPTRPVRHLEPTVALAASRRSDRAEVWRSLQDDFGRTHGSAAVQGHRDVVEQAITMMSTGSTEAFDLSQESAAAAQRYGSSKFGQGCLMARRLVERGVPFVEVGLRGWDTHADNFERVEALSGPLDTGVSALLDDLSARGLLEQTLVVCLGDFGRTPRINGRGGRDHYPRCSSVLMAGGGIAGGQVIGATDADGYEVADRPITVPDLLRTMATAMDIDPNETRMTPTGRPISMVDGGSVIDGLL
ncbi:MAG: DUF1501 domain-containing protein [Deltaproteobacteria bacterium]|nr:DUF1501 domain-containing protein [Deltaproteobacteria bacterium]